MAYIIDGNNLIGCSQEIPQDDLNGREKIVHLVKKFQEKRKTSVTVVFDGAPDYGSYQNNSNTKFKVVFPRYGKSADDEIKEILNTYNHFRDVTVVTSDRELKTYAKDKGAKTINSIEFYYELKRISRIRGKEEERKKRINQKLSDSEVDQWMKFFNGD
jgi:predicted RNA-binding protein with PIN domain